MMCLATGEIRFATRGIYDIVSYYGSEDRRDALERDFFVENRINRK